MSKSVREILETIHQQGYEGGYVKDDVDQALSALTKLYLGCVGKKKTHRILIAEEKDLLNGVIKGYNQCRAETIKNIKAIGK